MPRPLVVLVGLLTAASAMVASSAVAAPVPGVAPGMARHAVRADEPAAAPSAATSVAPAAAAAVAPGIGSLAGLKRSKVTLFDRSDAFREVAFRVVRTADGKVLFVGCALLAATENLRNQGMMRRKDLAGYDGMIFWFPQPILASFYMKTVPVNLSIAWLDATGAVVGTADMKREGDCGDRCPLYGPDASYRSAIEVLQGGLRRLRLGPDTRLLYGGACRAR